MKRISLKNAHVAFWLILITGIVLLSQGAFSQEPEFKPAIIEQPMPDFTLPAYQGGEITLSSLRGKNVLIIFPRGYAAEGRWCTIDDYKYAELLDLEKKEQLRKKYGLEILCVFPYSKDIVKQWLEAVPEQLDKIKDWKYPAEPDKQDEKTRMRTERATKLFPKDLSLEKGSVPTPFPFLIDEDRKLTRELGLFAAEWSGSKADQLIPSEFIIDKNGILKFKYIGQNTADRPSFDYLMRIVEMINKSK
jgi:peroxiredoxin